MFIYWRVVYIVEDSSVDGSIVCDVILDEEIALLDKEDVIPFFLDPLGMSSFQLSKTIWDTGVILKVHQILKKIP